MSTLEERGLFWWADDPVPDQQFAPENSVSGLLRIEDDGACFLELDGYLSNDQGPFSIFAQREISIEKRVRGLLKGSGQHVLLLGLIRHGGHMTTRGISYEGYIATSCLLSEEPITTGLSFTRIGLSLSGYEEWLRLRAIKVDRTKFTVLAKYKTPKKASYNLPDGSLSIEFKLDGASKGAFGTEVSMKASASAFFEYTEPLEFDDVKTQYQLFEDLLIVLTGSQYPLSWPYLRLANELECRLYFKRLGDFSRQDPPKFSDCTTNFVQLRDNFGSIWQQWRSKRAKLGPGLYLYLGTRRGLPLYTEHRFVNLVWGIEAFHRRRYDAVNQPTALKKKIERILSQIIKPKDKKWLAGKLENAHEPSLGERIFETLKAIPLGFEVTRLHKFSDACAKLRNDISHFGGQHHDGGSYNQFIVELDNMSEALDVLYQMLLLHEIGIDAKILQWWVFEGFRSFPIKWHLVQVGLLDKSVVEPKADATLPSQTVRIMS